MRCFYCDSPLDTLDPLDEYNQWWLCPKCGYVDFSSYEDDEIESALEPATEDES